MSVRLELSLALALFMVCSHATRAQLPPLRINQAQSRLQAVTIHGNLSETSVTGAPYSAIEESMYSQKEPDGTYVDKSLEVTHIYRDWEGRTRAERSVTSYHDGKSETHLMSIFILDPVTDSIYRLDPGNPIATRRSWAALLKEKSCFADTAEPQIPVTTESLGMQTLEGLVVEGYRQSLNIPAKAFGNRTEVDIVVETWISSDLKVAVLTHRDYSTVGRDTIQLTHIGRSEPDPALFQIPSDYKINDDGDGLGVGCTSQGGSVPH